MNLPINIDRKVSSELEGALCVNSFEAVLVFLQSMSSTAEKYKSKKQQNNLEEDVSTVILNAVDAYVMRTSLVVLQETISADRWPDMERVLNALEITEHLVRMGQGANLEYELSPALTDTANQIKAEILNHSQPLDVHRWSDHPEVNVFVDTIHDRRFTSRKAAIEKRHIKVVLLDLYVRWCIDPTMKTAVARNVNFYDSDSRYNAIHLSKKTIDVVDRLYEVGLVELVKGFYDPSNPDNSRQSRIWPTPYLIEQFKTVRFGLLDIGSHPDKEVIILRDQDPKRPVRQIDIEYTDDDNTNGMRERLQAYNNLIANTFVDIPSLEVPFVELSDRGRLSVNQSDKFTRRVFNRGSFEKGGRFYGGWWQRCPEEARKGIFLDDKPTVEVDFSGLHIVTLYANKGINYWQEVGTDPYELYLPEWGGLVPRSVCKLETRKNRVFRIDDAVMAG